VGGENNSLHGHQILSRSDEQDGGDAHVDAGGWCRIQVEVSGSVGNAVVLG